MRPLLALFVVALCGPVIANMTPEEFEMFVTEPFKNNPDMMTSLHACGIRSASDVNQTTFAFLDRFLTEQQKARIRGRETRYLGDYQDFNSISAVEYGNEGEWTEDFNTDYTTKAKHRTLVSTKYLGKQDTADTNRYLTFGVQGEMHIESSGAGDYWIITFRAPKPGGSYLTHFKCELFRADNKFQCSPDLTYSYVTASKTGQLSYTSWQSSMLAGTKSVKSRFVLTETCLVYFFNFFEKASETTDMHKAVAVIGHYGKYVSPSHNTPDPVDRPKGETSAVPAIARCLRKPAVKTPQPLEASFTTRQIAFAKEQGVNVMSQLGYYSTHHFKRQCVQGKCPAWTNGDDFASAEFTGGRGVVRLWTDLNKSKYWLALGPNEKPDAAHWQYITCTNLLQENGGCQRNINLAPTANPTAAKPAFAPPTVVAIKHFHLAKDCFVIGLEYNTMLRDKADFTHEEGLIYISVDPNPKKKETEPNFKPFPGVDAGEQQPEPEPEPTHKPHHHKHQQNQQQPSAHEQPHPLKPQQRV